MTLHLLMGRQTTWRLTLGLFELPSVSCSEASNRSIMASWRSFSRRALDFHSAMAPFNFSLSLLRASLSPLIRLLSAVSRLIRSWSVSPECVLEPDETEDG